ncbi:hypothetical protein MKW94_011230, partial [Papaver nudicaule]|nr:hypothetical protein [Papaver nudicaule]
MDFKKSGLLEKLCCVLSSKRKVISGFCFGVAISIFVFTIFFSISIFVFTSFDGIIVDSYSNYPWPFSFSTTTYSSELRNSTQNKTEYSELNLENTHELNLTEKDKNSTFFVHSSGVLSVVDKTHEKNSSVFVSTDQDINFSIDDDKVMFPEKDKFPRYGGDLSNCDIFHGKWVKIDEENTSYYEVSSCPYIDKDFDCHLNGRPDYDFLKWRWQPSGCTIP